jgi:DNA polymerase I-like protein with 3'-5' exonuclease and polymerase domains
MRLFKDLKVGADGRNRCMLSPFGGWNGCVTGRNTPSNAQYICGPAVWIRGLIKPSRGRAIAYCDWSGQEFGISAYLSGDSKMVQDYESGDPYLGFGKRVGMVPKDATKKTHPETREQLKVALGLGVMYGAGCRTVGMLIGQPYTFARELLTQHRAIYKRFWAWSQESISRGMLLGELRTVYGWTLHVRSGANPRTLSNFPCQGNGSEMLRLAVCLATERGIPICGSLHDALWVESSIDNIDEVVQGTISAMEQASRHVLGGAQLRTDKTVVRYPNRYLDKRGERMWSTVMGILAEIEESERVEEAIPF